MQSYFKKNDYVVIYKNCSIYYYFISLAPLTSADISFNHPAC